MSGATTKEPLWQLILIAAIVLGAVGGSLWHIREDHPDWALLAGAWVLVAFTVMMIRHLVKMKRAAESQQED